MSWNIKTPGDYINGPLTVAGSAAITGDLTVDTSTLKVDSANNRVIVGHTSGASPFQVSNAGGAGFEVQPTGVNSAPAILSYNRSGAAWIQLTYGASSHVWQNSGTDAMTLNSTGLGVGDSPSYKLHVAKTTDGTLGYFRRISGTINPALTVYCNETGNTVGFGTDYAGATSPSITFTTGGVERLRIDSSGNVGIGVTPSAVSGQTRVELKGSNGAGYVLRSGSTNTAARDWVIAANVSAFGDFVIRQGNSQGAEPNSGTDRFYIDPSGNTIFTISSTPPTLSANSQLTVNATSNTNLRFSYRGSDGVTRVANLTLA